MNAIPFRNFVAEEGSLRPEIDAAIKRVVDRGIFILGPEVDSFEQEWAEYCGTSHAVGCGSGLSAIELVLRAHDVGPGDEVIVPGYTFIATWSAVTAVGATVVPVDVLPDEFTIDPAAVAAAVTPRTVAVIAVHLFGLPARMDALRRIADRASLLLVEDAAQAHGAEYRGERCGSLGDAAAFSFYPTKNLGSLGDGGAVTTSDERIARRLRMLRNYGASHEYRHEVAGTNSRLDELQAAVLRVKLSHLERLTEERRLIASTYLHALVDSDVVLPVAPAGTNPAWHIFNIRTQVRDDMQEHLATVGIETKVYYPEPPHMSPVYREHMTAELPISTRLAATSLALPCRPSLDTAHVIAGVRAAIPDSSESRS